jgi:hypothetical protein
MFILRFACCLGCLLSLFIAINVLHFILYKEAFAYSPSFVTQLVINNNPVIDARSYKITEDDNITILSVNYESDGKFLNATIWLKTPLYKNLLPTTATFGMLIDADNNAATGMQGADYGIKIQWNSTSRAWERVFEQYETPSPKIGLSDKRTLDVEPYAKFYEEKRRYVSIDEGSDSLLS